MDENSKGKIHIYKAGPRGAAVRESDRQVIKTTESSAMRTAATPPRPLHLEINEDSKTN